MRTEPSNIIKEKINWGRKEMKIITEERRERERKEVGRKESLEIYKTSKAGIIFKIPTYSNTS